MRMLLVYALGQTYFYDMVFTHCHPWNMGTNCLRILAGRLGPHVGKVHMNLSRFFSYVILNPSSCHTQFCQTSARPDRVDSGSPQVCGRSGLYKLKDWLKLKPMPSIEHPKKMISWWLQMAHSHVHSHSHLIDVSTVRCTTWSFSDMMRFRTERRTLPAFCYTLSFFQQYFAAHHSFPAMEPGTKRCKVTIQETEFLAGLGSDGSHHVTPATLTCSVSLPSGHCEDVVVAMNGTVGDLKMAAQRSLGRPFLRLAAADGRILNPTESLQSAGVENGSCIAAIAQQPKIAATQRAFALWCAGGDRIVTWGKSDSGGDSTAVQDQLRNVEQVHATNTAFAAILSNETVVTWGNPYSGGNSTAVQDQLRDV